LALASPGTGTGMDAVCFDETNEHFDEELAFCRLQGAENSVVRGPDLGTEFPPQDLAGWCEAELTRPPVRRLDGTGDETSRFEPLDDYTNVVSVDAHRFRERALVNSRHGIDEDHHGIFKLDEPCASQSVSHHGNADLLESAYQRSCCAADQGAIACDPKVRGRIGSLEITT